MSYLATLKGHRDTFLRGLTFLLGGLALVLAGTLVGLAEGKLAQIGAGVVAVTGITLMFLGAVLYVIPPLLPDK